MKGTYIVIVLKDGTRRYFLKNYNQIKAIDSFTSKFDNERELIEWINKNYFLSGTNLIDYRQVAKVVISQKGKKDGSNEKEYPILYQKDKIDYNKIETALLNYICQSPGERIATCPLRYVRTEEMLEYQDRKIPLSEKAITKAIYAYFEKSNRSSIPYKKYRDFYFFLIEKGEIPSPYSHLKEITPQEDIEKNYHYDGDMLDLASCQGHQIGFDEYAEYLEGKVSNRPANPYTRRRIKD